MNVFEVAADPKRHVLYANFRGVIAGDDMAVSAAQNERLISNTKPGFTVVTDLAELERMELNCVPHVAKLMDLFMAAGVARIVRVIPDANKDIGFNLLSITHYRGQVPIVTFETRAEADAALG